MTLYIALTDDNFASLNIYYKIDFSDKKILFDKLLNFNETDIFKNPKNKILFLKVRKESFLNTLYNKLPWEDLSIGFQCKVLRKPNEYNVEFWHHFTNIYITDKNVRASTKCNSCVKLTDYFNQKIQQDSLYER